MKNISKGEIDMTELMWFVIGFTVTLAIVCAADILITTLSDADESK